MRLPLGKRSVVEADTIAIEEAVANMGWLVGLAGKLGVARHVDASKQDLAPVCIAEPGILDN